MEKVKVLKGLWDVKCALKGDDDNLKKMIIQLYEKLMYSTLKVNLDNVSDLTVEDLKRKIQEDLTDDELILFLRGRMEYDNPLVFLNYIVHCVKIIDYRKNRIDDVNEYYQRILSYIYSLYCIVREYNYDMNDRDFNSVINVTIDSAVAVVNKVCEWLLNDEDIPVDELFEFILERFKKDNPVKSIRIMFND